VTVDSDLSESIAALKQAFDKSGQEPKLGSASPELLGALEEKLRLPRLYRKFLSVCDPVEVEIVTPTERVCLLAASDLEKEQCGFALTPAGDRRSSPSEAGWRPEWVIIGHSGLLGDPYFLDVSKPDPEGDCPVYTAMSGQERWNPTLAASSFAPAVVTDAFERQIAAGFGDAIMDDEDEDSFREALGPKVKVIDAAALRAGHWT